MIGQSGVILSLLPYMNSKKNEIFGLLNAPFVLTRWHFKDKIWVSYKVGATF